MGKGTGNGGWTPPRAPGQGGFGRPGCAARRVRPGIVPALLVAILVSSGCGGPEAPETGDGASHGPPVARTDAAYDPAMAGGPPESGEDMAGMESQGEADVMGVAGQAPLATEPEGLMVDKKGCRVFLPAEGWVGVARFWDIYYHEPHLLPGSFDHSLLKDIALEGFDGEPGPGLACIGVADHRE